MKGERQRKREREREREGEERDSERILRSFYATILPCLFNAFDPSKN